MFEIFPMLKLYNHRHKHTFTLGTIVLPETTDTRATLYHESHFSEFHKYCDISVMFRTVVLRNALCIRRYT